MTRFYLDDYIPISVLEKQIARFCFEWESKYLQYIKSTTGTYLINNTCPHAGGEFTDANIIGSRIICPIHHYKFDIRTGQNISGEGYHLKTYKIYQDEHHRSYFEI